jgi:hypothetical protein
LVLLDAASGNPRIEIIDGVMLRLRSGNPDTLEVKLVQLKGGAAGLTAREWARLDTAVRMVSIEPLGVLTGRVPAEVAFLGHHPDGSAKKRRLGGRPVVPGKTGQ